MKKLLFLLVFFLLTHLVSAQNNIFPNITLKTIENTNFNVEELKNEPLVILSFWATWCSNCIYELDEINDEYSSWQNETNVKLIAISIDDYRTVSRVKPFLKSHQWPYKVLLDTNQKIKRALNINVIPYTIILKNGTIIYQKSGYAPTNLPDIYAVLKKSLK